MNILIWHRFFMGVQNMIRIDKIEAFSLVVRALDKDDTQTAGELMRIITKSIQKDRESNSFSEVIEISDRKDEQLIRRLLQRVNG